MCCEGDRSWSRVVSFYSEGLWQFATQAYGEGDLAPALEDLSERFLSQELTWLGEIAAAMADEKAGLEQQKEAIALRHWFRWSY